MYFLSILLTTGALLCSIKGHVLHYRKNLYLHRRFLEGGRSYRWIEISPPYARSPRNFNAIERSRRHDTKKRGLLHIDASALDSFPGCAVISWSWNWAQVPEADLPHYKEFVPTLWGNREEEDLSSRSKNAWAGISGGAKYLLAFNEPDVEVTAGGSSIAPLVAAGVYKQQLNPFKDVAILVSPSVCNGRGVRPGTGLAQGLDWLSEFYAHCGGFAHQGCAVDRVNVHWYYSYSGDLDEAVKSFESYLIEAFDRFEKPLWVTEFQLQNAAVAVEAEFMRRAFAFMDGAGFVDCYSYFTADYVAENGDLLAAYVER